MSADDPATIDAVAAVIVECMMTHLVVDFEQGRSRSMDQYEAQYVARCLLTDSPLAGWLRTAEEILTEADRAEAGSL